MDYQHFGGHAKTIYLNGNPDNDLARESLNEVAGYLNFQQLLWHKLSVNAGVRIDHHSLTGNEWVPQFGVSWFAGENTVVKGIVSKGFRNPTIRELYMFGSQNPELEPESLMNYELSLNQGFMDNTLRFGLNVFYIKGKNSIVEVETPDGWRWKNTGELENYGAEVSGTYRVNRHLGLNANYSYIHMKRDIDATPRHKLYAGADYTLRRWNFATGIQFVKDLIKDSEAGSRETFTVWNARVSFRVNEWLDLTARGENLLAQRYEINAGFPMPRATVFAGILLRL